MNVVGETLASGPRGKRLISEVSGTVIDVAQGRIVPLENARGVHRDAIAALVGQAWTVSPVGDRTGARLDGAPIPPKRPPPPLVSTGVIPGVIQLLPSGLPVSSRRCADDRRLSRAGRGRARTFRSWRNASLATTSHSR
jgi:allophanate hydrolase subunit 2